MMWVPPGFAHGFLVTSDVADFQYKCTDFYAPEYERTVHWADSDLAIEWPLAAGSVPGLSEKDAAGASLENLDVYP
jgi:dTDP-4-dehydrorhamnose 3,5-epimerase